MAKFDIEFELMAEGLTLNGNEVCVSEADPVAELVAEANDLGDYVAELVMDAKSVLCVAREPIYLWQERAEDPRRDEGYFWRKMNECRGLLFGILQEASDLQGVVENDWGRCRTVREWAVAWYWWATSSLEDVGAMTDYERAAALFLLTGEQPDLENYIKDVARRLLHSESWLKEIREDDPHDGGYLERSVGEDVDMLRDELKFYSELRLAEMRELGRR